MRLKIKKINKLLMYGMVFTGCLMISSCGTGRGQSTEQSAAKQSQQTTEQQTTEQQTTEQQTTEQQTTEKQRTTEQQTTEQQTTEKQQTAEQQKKQEGSYMQITQEEAKNLMDTEENYIILDVRTEEEFAGGHIPGAICVPNETITDEDVSELPDKEQLILVYCRSGNRSRQAAEKLAAIGYSNVKEFGGINTWNYEIEK